MRTQLDLELAERPRLTRKARLRFDARTGGHLLLSPERGLLLNPSAAQVVLACDGKHSVLEIARTLSSGANLELVACDILEFLSELRSRRLIEMAAGSR
jgi:pyrroloquinoline quinone biosynthesis protein D